MVHESEKKYEAQKRKGGNTTGIQNVKKHDLPQQKSTNLFVIAEPEWISPNFPLKKIPSIETHGTRSSQRQLAMPQRTGKFVRICFFWGERQNLLWWPCSNYVECKYIYIINQRKLICDLSPPKTKNNFPFVCTMEKSWMMLQALGLTAQKNNRSRGDTCHKLCCLFSDMEPEQGTVNSIESWNHMCFCSNTHRENNLILHWA